jgi:hypothetical protein
MKKYFNNWWLISMLTFFTGIGMLIYYYSAKSLHQSAFFEFWGTVGKTMLASGLFLAILKSFQFLGIFQEELRKVIYTDEFLSKRKDIKEVWGRTTQALFETLYPEIGKEIENAIYNKHIPNKLNFFYSDMDVSYTVKKLDDDHIELIETQYITLSTGQKTTEYKFYHHVIVPNETCNIYKKDDILDVVNISVNDIDRR